VRQLRSTVRRAVLLADEMVTEEHLDILHENRETSTPAALPAQPPALPAGDLPLKQIVAQNRMAVEREALLRTLRKTGGNKARAARLLQVDYKTIQSKIKRYGITPNQDSL
jgi:two-component system nitrogen regulation response regulator GlnG